MAIPGEIIKQARESRGKSQHDLAEIIGKSQGYIAKLENNNMKGGIKGDELLLIAEYLEFDPRIFNGRISIKDGDLKYSGYKQTISELIKEVHSLRGKYNLDYEDDLVMSINKKPALKKLLLMAQKWPEEKIKRMTDLAFGYFSGVMDREEDQDQE
ncbi:MAG: helix-turn-helix transcriptional regulator [Spirochaetales bacterium]|nr:helix-turn-helix transcriptional regulator [Spirochaetales bacterium]